MRGSTLNIEPFNIVRSGSSPLRLLLTTLFNSDVPATRLGHDGNRSNQDTSLSGGLCLRVHRGVRPLLLPCFFSLTKADVVIAQMRVYQATVSQYRRRRGPTPYHLRSTGGR